MLYMYKSDRKISHDDNAWPDDIAYDCLYFM